MKLKIFLALGVLVLMGCGSEEVTGDDNGGGSALSCKVSGSFQGVGSSSATSCSSFFAATVANHDEGDCETMEDGLAAQRASHPLYTSYTCKAEWR